MEENVSQDVNGTSVITNLSIKEVMPKLITIIASIKNGDEDIRSIIESSFGGVLDKKLKAKLAKVLINIKQYKAQHDAGQLTYKKYLQKSIASIIDIVSILAPPSAQSYLLLFKKNIVNQIILAVDKEDSNISGINAPSSNRVDGTLRSQSINNESSKIQFNKYLRR